MGGRITAPFYITEGEPYRPEFLLWVEVPGELVISFALVNPNEPEASLGDALEQALDNPMVGPARTPSRIRVADKSSILEVERVLPQVDIVRGPTPELNRILEAMLESEALAESGLPPSYLPHEAITPEMMRNLFESARSLYQMSPWKVMDDSQVLRLDIPDLDVEAACLSVIGALGEALGFIIFPSYVAFENYLDAAGGDPAPPGQLDLRTDTLALVFERGADLPASMLREVTEHGWPVADANAYPTVQHRDRDGALRPLTGQDVHVVAACAASFGVFFGKHAQRLERDVLDEPVCESYFDNAELEVRFTLPYEAASLVAVSEARGSHRADRPPRASSDAPQDPASPKVGRNAACPCGSGKKYKKCCLAKQQSLSKPAEGRQPIHEVDARLVDRLVTYGLETFGSGWLHRARDDFDELDLAAELLNHWAIFHAPIGKRTLVDWAIEDRALRLSSEEDRWLEAQRAAWLSLWEVLEVAPGKSILLRDLLTHEQRHVSEASASMTARVREVFLARIVDHEDTSVLCGLYLRLLPPLEADDVHQRVRKRLRLRRAVPIDRLRNEKIGRYMIRCWEEALGEWDLRRKIPPRLQNTDGDDLLLTTDHFEFDRGDRAKIEHLLRSMEDLAEREGDGPQPDFTFLDETEGRPNQVTLIGAVTLSGGTLRLETNSVPRADRLRARLESVLAALVQHRIREHTDPIGLLNERSREERPRQVRDAKPTSDEEDRLILESKHLHYADWADHPLPAFRDKTAREMVRTKSGRERVSLLIKTLEHAEAGSPAGQRFDFGSLRRELGLEE